MTAGDRPSPSDADASRVGVVAEFDERRGLGLVVGDDGARHGFHCTAIVDGSRSIAIGVPVRYGLRIGPLGIEEATAVSPA
ncbi:MAG: cold-shock protein [Acidimicrobiia bacterium]|nr:cold-shock protein [Acidimicrobiia bacterium]